ncbi:hypothetical protein Snas_1205 [Stackebrandtia nassauensis DSM 44728]|uniref:Uncharacterized protein n=1 Tax=Stackebrandtia nassauensis (strain DSM 44728 / CIP 108903 / NRRL B-16338 / NBRC 102104 / LLR-40K-21) TaxID=446470 RepID=D3QB98_STANL|nr:hypothetical protein Snas_1205 [Stackebrandtia nassauensis DSM 44728]
MCFVGRLSEWQSAHEHLEGPNTQRERYTRYRVPL